MKTYVIYHASCADGFTAAWAAWKKLGDENVEYIPCNYSDTPPVVEVGSKVYFVDFSFKRPVLEGWKNLYMLDVTIIDHHKSAQEDLEGLDYAIFDMTKSGARLAWEYFHPGTEIPKTVIYVEDRDLWKYLYAETKPACAYLGLSPYRFQAWDAFQAKLETDFEKVIEKGSGIVEYIEERAKAAASKVTWKQIAGHRVPVLNCTHAISETLHQVLEKYADAKFSVGFFVTSRGEFVYSLRSRGDFNVKEIAVAFGGGGHDAAAGFTRKEMIRDRLDLPTKPVAAEPSAA